MIISLLMIALIVTLSIMNSITLYKIRIELSDYLENMTQKLYNGSAQDIVEDTENFKELWHEREEKLVRFIRHSDLEQITWDSARLPELARYGDTSELAAEIKRIQLQVNHLWETQMPRLRTVF
ncbi:uncharacterized protein DUF4363 [Hydrogenoanaerobacterium saccharovorans]|uniref:LemA protein n=1 Tax=Hydrogenoanaerobacterium saccharovorans TaxID=474960 RepID=A0A1H8A012_9FIRM|nr:DUF4363 family protein [Hydrogenoanaerobacterium saccharovorans]RPF48307.1 uncharacterized protein DUF4363 [Hydrogenoanaerobacterium saccharovorans]SEM63178.1 protein of unknown function [Hydrogenoanaerobacterium saccharovorans]